MPFKATSSDLNRVSYGYFGWFGWKGLKYPKRNIIKRREPRDVIAQAQAPKKVVGPMVKERLGSDEREIGRWIDRGEEGGGCRRGIWENHTGLRGGKAR